MLHLVHAVHQKLGATGTRLKSFYISEEKTFPEVDSFMTATVERYSLANKEFPGPMRPALAAMLEQDSAVQATVLGVRRYPRHCSNINDQLLQRGPRVRQTLQLLPDGRGLAAGDAGQPRAGLDLPPGVDLHPRAQSPLPQSV